MATKRNAALSPEHVRQIEQDVLQLVERTIETEFENAFYPLAVNFEKEFGHWNLKIFVEHLNVDTRISIDDCESLSKTLNPLLDELKRLEPLSYNLEVSSPGLFRQLTTEREFRFYEGRQVQIQLPEETDDSASLPKLPVEKGILDRFDKDTGTVFIRPLEPGSEPVAVAASESLLITLCPAPETPSAETAEQIS